MIRLIWRFAILVALAVFFAWLADRPGTITIRWLDREIETSFVIAVAIVALLFAALWFVWGMLRTLWRSPGSAREYFRFRKTRKGYESLSRGIIAAGAGDKAAATRHAAVAANALSDEPLVNVLAAQAAQLRGDHQAVKRLFEMMAKSPDTEALGLRGLFAEARQAGDAAAAMAYAERALALNPGLAWASSAVLLLQSMRKDWQGAAATLTQQLRAGLAGEAEAGRKRAAILAALALSEEDARPDDALSNARQALKLDPSLVPAALVAARREIARGSARKAAKVIRETWKLSPHPDLAEVFAHLKPGEGPEARFERVRDLVSGHDGGMEGAFALARAAVAAQRFDVARKALHPFVDDQPQARICALMAEIEEAQGDAGRAREWLARAVRAPRDPVWVSDGVASLRWTPVSPVSGEIVPCEWRAPFDMIAEERPAGRTPETAVDTSPKPTAEAPREASPALATALPRPPDDPGPPDENPEPEAAARRSLAADG